MRQFAAGAAPGTLTGSIFCNRKHTGDGSFCFGFQLDYLLVKFLLAAIYRPLFG